jgi:uncharacterized repeat protein (TIGR03803 family)
MRSSKVWAAVLLNLLIAGLGAGNAGAKYKVLHNFCAETNCTDGDTPVVGLSSDGKGNFYGATYHYNSADFSTRSVFFKLSGTGGRYKYKELYSTYCVPGCPDGSLPAGELVVDTSGNLYGAMYISGVVAGTIFQITTDNKFHVLYNFCTTDCKDGENPYSPLIYIGENAGTLYDGVSPLYGTTSYGGAWAGGVAYSFTPGKGEKVLFAFCQNTRHKQCASGEVPHGEVAVDQAGTMYGANQFDTGGVGGGLLWSVTPANVLHRFCDAYPCKDGLKPDAGISLDPDSPIVFGTTDHGGRKNGGGIAYQLNLATQNYSILHTFCTATTHLCRDGEEPSSTLYPDGTGGVLGTASAAGAHSGGTLYRIDLTTRKLQVLHAFCKDTNCTDGGSPGGRIVQYEGRIFGVTHGGGKFGDGVIYQYTP